jgi:hypothetical protein
MSLTGHQMLSFHVLSVTNGRQCWCEAYSRPGATSTTIRQQTWRQRRLGPTMRCSVRVCCRPLLTCSSCAAFARMKLLRAASLLVQPLRPLPVLLLPPRAFRPPSWDSADPTFTVPGARDHAKQQSQIGLVLQRMPEHANMFSELQHMPASTLRCASHGAATALHAAGAASAPTRAAPRTCACVLQGQGGRNAASARGPQLPPAAA